MPTFRGRCLTKVNPAVWREVQLVLNRQHLIHQILLDHEGTRFRVLGDVGDFGRCQAEIDGHGHQPSARQTHIELDPFDAVVGQQGDAVTFAETHVEQGIGQSCGPVVPLKEAQRTTGIAGAELVGL